MYVKAKCKKDNKYAVAAEVKAALHQVGKAMDTNNARKIRPTLYLLFLSWAQFNDARCKLSELLGSDVWELEAADIEAVLKGLRKIFTLLEKTAPARSAKRFRAKVKKELLDMASSEKQKKVCIVAPSRVLPIMTVGK